MTHVISLQRLLLKLKHCCSNRRRYYRFLYSANTMYLLQSKINFRFVSLLPFIRSQMYSFYKIRWINVFYKALCFENQQRRWRPWPWVQLPTVAPIRQGAIEFLILSLPVLKYSTYLCKRRTNLNWKIYETTNFTNLYVSIGTLTIFWFFCACVNVNGRSYSKLLYLT